MKEKIINFEDLSYSREMLEAEAPNFIAIFIYILLALIIVGFTWMWFGEIDVVVKARGIVRPIKNDSLVQNIRGGEIKQLNYEEGKKVNKGDILYTIKGKTLNLKQSDTKEQIQELKSEISKLKKLKKSIDQGENLFTKGEELRYYNRYLAYEFKHEQLQIKYNQAKDKYLKGKDLLESGAITGNEFEQAKAKYHSTKLDLQTHKNKTLINIKDEIKNKEDKLISLKQKYESITDKIEASRIEAPISGKIHVIRKFNEGDYIPSGVEVLRVIPDTDSNFEMEITVNNEDISELETGQKVKYRFLALPYKEYGTLSGKITKISSDASMSSKNSKLPYNVKATINGVKLYDKKGKPEYIKPGMIGKTRVVVRRKKILYFVLEKLDFIS